MSTRAEQRSAEIADAILSGPLPPGARLNEQGLADRYDVSRTPVRKALRLLAARGLIEVRPRRGSTVTQVSSAKLVDLFFAMGEIEATCARLAALSMSPIVRRQLESLHKRMAGTVDTCEEADMRMQTCIFIRASTGVRKIPSLRRWLLACVAASPPFLAHSSVPQDAWLHLIENMVQW